jgi:hypothetical protein
VSDSGAASQRPPLIHFRRSSDDPIAAVVIAEAVAKEFPPLSSGPLEPEGDALSAARGILIGTLLGAALWALAIIVYLAVRSP